LLPSTSMRSIDDAAGPLTLPTDPTPGSKFKPTNIGGFVPLFLYSVVSANERPSGDDQRSTLVEKFYLENGAS